MRLIDADRLKRKIQKEATKAWKLKIKASVETIMNQFIDWINEAPTIEPEQRWIPCSERLPKKVGDYLVTTHSGQIARYIYLGNGTSKEYWMRCVVAWMPLPKPYRSEGDDKHEG